MFCNKCGAQLEDGAKFCNKCGANLADNTNNAEVVNKQDNSVESIVLKELNKTSNTENNATIKTTQSTVSPKVSAKNNKLIMIVAAGALLIGGLVYMINSMPKNIPYLSNVVATYSGGEGYGRVSVDYEYSDKMQELLMLADEYEMRLSNPFGLKEKEIIKMKTKMEAINALDDSFACSFDKNEKLKNGDEVTYTCTYDEVIAKSLNVKITDTSKTFTVEGLSELTPLDVFNGVTVGWKYSSYYGYEINVENLPSEISSLGYGMKAGEVDENGNVLVTYYEKIDSIAERGFVPDGEGIVVNEEGYATKEYHVGKKPTKVQTRAAEINDANYYDEKICMIREKSDYWIWTTLEKFNYTLYPSWRGSAITVNEYKLSSINDNYATYYLKCSDNNTYYMDIKYNICLYEDGSYEDLTTESDHQYSGKYSGSRVY